MNMAKTEVPKVLLVEDDAGYAKTVVQILSDMTVTHVRSYKEALEVAKNVESFDCALVDLNLVDDSDGRGRSVISILKRRRADLPVAALTAFEPGVGNTFETTLREIGADDIVKKSGNPQHGNILRSTVERLLDGELQPLISQRIAATFEDIADAAKEWRTRQSRSAHWRTIIRRHFGSDRVPYLADPLVRVSEAAMSDLSVIERDLLRSFGRRGSVELVNRARNSLDATLKQHEASWVSVTTISGGPRWMHRLAGWLARLDLTVLLVLAGVFLAFAGNVLVRWKLDHTHLSHVETMLLTGGMVSGLSTASLVGTGEKIHSRVREAWADSPDAFKVEELICASLWQKLLTIGFLVLCGFGMVLFSIVFL